MAMKGRSTCRLMQREGAEGASAREAVGEGRPRAAGLNHSKLCRFPRKGAGRFVAEGRPKGRIWVVPRSMAPSRSECVFAAVFLFSEQGGLRMKCPVCGKEMTAGMLQAGRAVYFVDEEQSYLLLRPKGSAVLLTTENFSDPKNDTAWCCRDCKKVVVDYTDIPQSNLKSLF